MKFFLFSVVSIPEKIFNILLGTCLQIKRVAMKFKKGKSISVKLKI